MATAQSLVYVRIFHGSVWKYPWKKRTEEKIIGGFWGGHVAVQIDDRVYGFYYQDVKRIHIFPHPKQKNCLFQNQSLAEWQEIIANKRETVIEIPISDSQKENLLQFYASNILTPEKDYSFIGERCASSCYHLLKNQKLISGRHYLLQAFYPEQFRRYLVKQALKKNWKVYSKEGSTMYWWTGKKTTQPSAFHDLDGAP